MLCHELLRNHGRIPRGGIWVSAALPSQRSSIHLPDSHTGMLQAVWEPDRSAAGKCHSPLHMCQPACSRKGLGWLR